MKPKEIAIVLLIVVIGVACIGTLLWLSSVPTSPDADCGDIPLRDGTVAHVPCTVFRPGKPNDCLRLDKPICTPTPTVTSTPTMPAPLATAAIQATISALISPTSPPTPTMGPAVATAAAQATIRVVMATGTPEPTKTSEPPGLVFAPEIRPQVRPIYGGFTPALLDCLGAFLIVLGVGLFFYLWLGKGGHKSVGKMSKSVTKTMDWVDELGEKAWGIVIVVILIIVGIAIILAPTGTPSATPIQTPAPAPIASPTSIRIEIVVPTQPAASPTSSPVRILPSPTRR